MKMIIALFLLAIGCQTADEPVSDVESVSAESACPSTVIELREGAIWEVDDIKVFERAIQRCGELYKNSPCVKKIIKLGRRDNTRYRVICGGDNEPDKQGAN